MSVTSIDVDHIQQLLWQTALSRGESGPSRKQIKLLGSKYRYGKHVIVLRATNCICEVQLCRVRQYTAQSCCRCGWKERL